MSQHPSSAAPSSVGPNLLGGLLTVAALLFAGVLALSDPWLGCAVGTLLLVVAWRVRPPSGARVLRWITGAFGMFLLGYDALVLLVR